MKRNNIIVTADLFGYIEYYFDNIKLGNRFSCKTYSVCSCAYETTFRIEEDSKYYIEILFINQNISSLLIVKRRFLKNKIFEVLLLRTKEELESFNCDVLKNKIKKLSEMTEIKLKKIL